MELKRYFHAVGQGAFYHEEFYNRGGYFSAYHKGRYPIHFLTVYDCGSENKERLLAEINGMISDEIDLLFISHFDTDHVNGMRDLSKKCKIKNVVMPYLSRGIKAYYLLEKIYEKVESIDVFDLILNPTQYLIALGIENYIYIENEAIDEEDKKTDDRDKLRPIDNEYDKYDIPFQMDMLEVGSISSGENYLKSKTPIVLQDVWKWIPFYYNQGISDEIYYKVEELVGILSEKSILDSNWIFDNLEKKFEIKKEIIDLVDIKKTELGKEISLRRLLNLIYKQYNTIINKGKDKSDENGSNINSLVVYSGPTHYAYSTINKCYHESFGNAELDNQKLGCLFCGDYNGKEDDSYEKLGAFFARHLDGLGIIQIPHHGSRKNYRKGLEGSIPISIVSFGEINKYGHPDWNVYKYLIDNVETNFVYVTDDLHSTCIQTVYFEY